jgi:hypothetical protein
MISLSTAPSIPPILIAAAFGFSGLMAIPPVAIISSGDREIPTAIIVFLFSILVGGFGLFLWRYRHQHRNNRLEIHPDGLKWVIRNEEAIIPWSDVAHISVNKIVAQRTECPAFRIQLKNARIIRVCSPTGGMETISLAMSNKVATAITLIERATRSDREMRIHRELEAGGWVEVGGGLSFSKYGARIGKRELPWEEVVKLERHLFLMNGHGTPSIKVYHQTKSPHRPWCTVVEANVWDVDIVLPFCLSRIDMAHRSFAKVV